ncbi:MAG: aspartate kinase [SAR202 cluster bacterium]|jgi:aspartate kinase|nr:aspartate kinase [Chloroflexota bacterium]MDP6421511.1 aspartate kinase [SAR202 cluster bacterium]HAL49487.1 aspartate kinase [Dehalococcoidia bacterium]MDP6664782.1 aspartate kinase [SAR202 cluster bacterium]MDP6801205.1 aspartate kinase [SAR202 cluster bacterium]|tara:strand:- start:9127 stop:10359 length:1233 start_codon:yes stop_codon:yes gene_type:complete
MALVVQKYGGSSLADAEQIKSVARRIARTCDAGNQVVVVVSAMGDTTDELIELANSISNHPDPREMDVLLSTGELVSCTITAMALRSLGYRAISLSGAQAGITTNTSHGQAQIAGMNPERIMEELTSGDIVIVAGFQGVTPEMDVTTLGRGGSDTTAVALAAALRAARCEVYTDVDGIYTADPRRVPRAQKLDEIGFEEMLELASYGAKMNPRSIELGMVYDTPILVASSFDDTPGTLIHGEADMNRDVGEIRNRVGGIATDTNVAKITVLSVRDRPGIAASLFEPLADQGISVDVIVQNASVGGATDLTFTVKRTDLGRAQQVVEEVARELGGGEVVTASDLAKLSIVGTGMLDATGYASKMFRTLADAKINIEMITTSEIRITCIVAEAQLDRAARALHSAFDLDKPE